MFWFALGVLVGYLLCGLMLWLGLQARWIGEPVDLTDWSQKE